MKKRTLAEPLTLEPIGIRRTTAAAYIDVSPTLFDQMVADGRMPRPKVINSRRVWDRRKVAEAFTVLEEDARHQEDEWDDWEASNEGWDPVEAARRNLTRWEEVLLLGLLRRHGSADVDTIEGAGPHTRAELVKRGYITDDGKTLCLTDDSVELAKVKARWV